MALIRRGDPSLLLQPNWEIVEAEDNSLRATLLYKGDRGNEGRAPRLGDRMFSGHPLNCFERRRRFERLNVISVQCDFIGIARDPTPYKIEFPGGSGTEPIESHPNFPLFAGTPGLPRNGAIFDDQTGEFVGFADGQCRGVRSYIVPDVRVNLTYWTYRTPNSRRITKELAASLTGVPRTNMVLNYLLIGMPCRQFGPLWQVTEQWLGSGPRGWNRLIY